MPLGRRDDRATERGTLAGEHLVQQHPKAVHIRPRGDRLAADLFGGAIARRSEHVRPGGPRIGHIPSDPEIGDVGVPLPIQQDVLGLHVPVDDALSMRRRQRVRDLIEGLRDVVRWKGAILLDRLPQAAAAKEPHDEIRAVRVAPVVVERNHVGVLEPSDELRFALEPADEPRVVREVQMDRLDRDLPTDLWLEGSMDDPERALADAFQQPVSPQRLTTKLE